MFTAAVDQVSERTARAEASCRIMFVIDSLVAGGAERHLVRVATALKAQGTWDVSVYCLSREGTFVQALCDAGVPVHGGEAPWSKRPSHLIKALLRLALYMRRVKPDIAHCYLQQGGLLGALAARAARIPHVITTRRWVHNYHGMKLVEFRFVAALMDLCSDVVICVCDAARFQAIREGTPAQKTMTIRNSVETRPAVATRVRGKEDEPIFGSVGELHARKGQRYLVEAIPLVLAHIPQARFTLVGDGEERARLVTLARTLGVEHRVTFSGESQDGRGALAGFDVFVLPSLMEGVPNVVLEAMAEGVPVVATRVGGVPEIIEDGRTGLLVEPAAPAALADALVRMWRGNKDRSGYVANARKEVTERFNVDNEVEQTSAVYAALMSKT